MWPEPYPAAPVFWLEPASGAGANGRRSSKRGNIAKTRDESNKKACRRLAGGWARTCLLRLAAALGERLLGVAGSFALLPATALGGFLIITVPLDLLGQTFLLAQLLETSQHLLDTLVGSRPDLNRRHTVPFLIDNTGQPKLRIHSPSQGKNMYYIEGFGLRQ